MRRERDEAWRQELEAQREAAEAAQAELQHRLEASQAAEQRLQESGEALERRHAASLEDRGRERDAFWLQVGPCLCVGACGWVGERVRRTVCNCVC